MPFFKQVTNTNELLSLELAANEEKTHAVGITKSGNFYTYDAKQKNHKKITVDEAQEILKVTDEQMQEIIDSRGTCVFEEVQEAEAEVAEEHIQSDNDCHVHEEDEECVDVIFTSVPVSEVLDTINRIEDKIDKLAAKIDAFILE